MTVQVFSPQISVILRKNIGRATIAGTIAASQRFQGTARTLDLTRYWNFDGHHRVAPALRRERAQSLLWGEPPLSAVGAQTLVPTMGKRIPLRRHWQTSRVEPAQPSSAISGDRDAHPSLSRFR
jgi:hypothetical protein